LKMTARVKTLTVLTMVLSLLFSPMAAYAYTSDDVVTLTKRLVGRDYTYGGESPREGFDSSGLIHYVFTRLDYEVPRAMKAQANMDAPLYRDLSNIKPGDVLFFGKSGKILYNGIYIGDGKFVAANKGKDEVIVHSLTKKYRTYFLGARRVADATEAPAEPTLPETTEPDNEELPTEEETQPVDQNAALYASLVKSAESYLGTSYLLGAKYGQTQTFDCSSFTKTVFAEQGIYLKRSSAQQAAQGVSVAFNDLQVGDLLFYWLDSTSKEVGHVAVYVGNGEMIHSLPGRGVIKTSAGWWKSHYLGAKRVIQ
jgi:cell wall-associated NlpC family hydrolase